MSDFISRQAAIDELVKMLSDCFYADEEVLDAVKTTLKELPPALHKRKTGHWIKSDKGVFLCSECNSGYKNQPTCMGKPMFEFCPICGADMRKEVDQ